MKYSQGGGEQEADMGCLVLTRRPMHHRMAFIVHRIHVGFVR